MTTTLTVNRLAAHHKAKAGSLMKMLQRWPVSKTKRHLFTDEQREFIDGMDRNTVFPEWLTTIWREHYVPKGTKGTTKRKVRKADPPPVVSDPVPPDPDPVPPVGKSSDLEEPPVSVHNGHAVFPNYPNGSGNSEKMDVPEWITFPFRDYNMAKFALLGFQSFIFAVFAYSVIDQKLTGLGVPYRIPFELLWVIGFFVDAAGFVVARKLPKPVSRFANDPRNWWLFGFFFFQVALDICLIFYQPGNIVSTIGQVLVFMATAFAIAAYSRSDFNDE